MADMNDKLNELTKMEDKTSEFDPKDIQDNKVMAILAYLSWLVLVPILAARESKFAMFHANQGILLAIAEVAVWVVFGVLSIIPFLGFIFIILNVLCNVVFLVYAILGIINAANGQAKELPIIGKIRILK